MSAQTTAPVRTRMRASGLTGSREMQATTREMGIDRIRETGLLAVTPHRPAPQPTEATVNSSAGRAPEPLVDTTRVATRARKPTADEAACSLVAADRPLLRAQVAAEVAGDSHEYLQLNTLDT